MPILDKKWYNDKIEPQLFLIVASKYQITTNDQNVRFVQGPKSNKNQFKFFKEEKIAWSNCEIIKLWVAKILHAIKKVILFVR